VSKKGDKRPLADRNLELPFDRPPVAPAAKVELALEGVLNDPQREAVTHLDGPLLIFAGAGSGKTRVITYRVANLVLHGVPPYRILAVTFTNKAAGEMRHRLEQIVGPDITKDLWVGTFHAICARLLRRHADAVGLSKSFVVYDDADQRAVINRVFKDLRINDKHYPPKLVLSRIHRAKQEGLGPDAYPHNDYIDEVVEKCFVAYTERLAAANAVDFDDLILHVMRLSEDLDNPVGDTLRKRFRHVMVDEFQDVNIVQYRLVRALSREHQNLCVVGDDDQSIYRWRGADVRIVRGFRRDLPSAKVVKLEQNYRSAGHVVAAALGVIRPARDREPKQLWTHNEAGDPVAVVATASERDEAAFVALSTREAIASGISADQIAIFYRTHAQSRVLEEVMRTERIPYQVVGGMRFFERAEIKDLLSYLRVLINPESDVDLLRIINTPPRKIGDGTVERLIAMADGSKTSVFAAIPGAVASKAVGPQGCKALHAFHSMMEELRQEALTASPRELAAHVLERTGIADGLRRDDRAESEARLLNLQELLGSIEEYEADAAAAGETASLAGFLERVSLSSSVDEMEDEARVSLMTVHSAKGLEFEVVFVTGMEEDIFPFRSADPTRRGDDEEERRLAYVAITRARKKLVISHAQRRQIFGMTRYNAPSRFVRDLPAASIQTVVTQLAGESPGRFLDRPLSAERAPGPWVHPQRGGGMVAAPPREPGERYIERDDLDQSDGAVVRRGARVFHKSFGLGTVMSIDTGPDPTATVRFEGWAPKRIKVRFLEPGA
jgi:DNA helicase II / ATP-dependent DNA helicase PcrA